MNQKIVNASEEQARELMESSRETTWQGKGFLRSLFLGSLNVDWIDPFPETPVSAEFQAFYEKLEAFLEEEVDSIEIDATGEYPKHVVDGLFKLGAMGMKIDKKYGGKGFNTVEYCKALELVGRYDGNLVALMSAHQSIGIPQPVKLFGSEEQKQKYLPPCATRSVSAFALTEPDVGSDPARVGSTLDRDENGDYILNGTKLWITNSTMADFLVVMARHPDTNKISAVIVEMDWEGVEIVHRCRFMGLKALANGLLTFKNVKVPKENMLGKEGWGLRIAFTTLNVGRLSIPAACVGASKLIMEEMRVWCNERAQWGRPIGKHEAITHKLADLGATTYAMDTLSTLANELSLRDDYDIRLEAAAAKEWCTTRGWDMIDEAMQIRGGRGYETEQSLRDRGERPVGIERNMRDSRINRIFEGSSEIMHLFMARELLDKHLKLGEVFIDPKRSISDKIAALPAAAAFYSTWYPKLWLGWLFRPSYDKFGSLAKYLKFVEANSRKLARSMFHAMIWYGKKLETKQAFVFRAVDIAMELFVMAATVIRTRKLLESRAPEGRAAVELTDMYCRNAQRYVDARFAELWNNDDDKKYQTGRAVLEGRHSYLEPVRTWQGPAAAEAEEVAAPSEGETAAK